MGSVHEAEEEVSGRRVALKLIASEFTASSMAVERFLQEGRLASVLAHPRCVFVLAADQADGWPYIVMELMPGHTLKDLVESQGPLPQGDALLKIMDVIEGLQEAHRLGVIHRDVKPSNCFLDLENRVKIGDFGLSKSLVAADSNLTRTGSFLGTPHYASPEQIKGELIDERSDLYSVAATLFYLLTGKPPHDANDPTVALARIVSESARPIRSLRPEVWSALDQVVLRGLERDRRRRYRFARRVPRGPRTVPARAGHARPDRPEDRGLCDRQGDHLPADRDRLRGVDRRPRPPGAGARQSAGRDRFGADPLRLLRPVRGARAGDAGQADLRPETCVGHHQGPRGLGRGPRPGLDLRGDRDPAHPALRPLLGSERVPLDLRRGIADPGRVCPPAVPHREGVERLAGAARDPQPDGRRERPAPAQEEGEPGAGRGGAARPPRLAARGAPAVGRPRSGSRPR